MRVRGGFVVHVDIWVQSGARVASDQTRRSAVFMLRRPDSSFTHTHSATNESWLAWAQNPDSLFQMHGIKHPPLRRPVRSRIFLGRGPSMAECPKRAGRFLPLCHSATLPHIPDEPPP